MGTELETLNTNLTKENDSLAQYNLVLSEYFKYSH